MESKLDLLKRLIARGEHSKALQLAGSWPDLGKHKAAIQRGKAAINNRQFYIEIGQDPDNLVAAGLLAIFERYDIPSPSRKSYPAWQARHAIEYSLENDGTSEGIWKCWEQCGGKKLYGYGKTKEAAFQELQYVKERNNAT